MKDKFIVFLLVVVAIFYVYRKLRAEAKGEGGCGSHCSDDQRRKCGCSRDFSQPDNNGD
jgi:hypothetical protein